MPHARTATVRPPTARAPRCAAPSTPSAAPETTVTPWSASSADQSRATHRPYSPAARAPTMPTQRRGASSRRRGPHAHRARGTASPSRTGAPSSPTVPSGPAATPRPASAAAGHSGSSGTISRPPRAASSARSAAARSVPRRAAVSAATAGGSARGPSVAPSRTSCAASTGPISSTRAPRAGAGGSATRERYARARRTSSGTGEAIAASVAVVVLMRPASPPRLAVGVVHEALEPDRLDDVGHLGSGSAAQVADRPRDPERAVRPTGGHRPGAQLALEDRGGVVREPPAPAQLGPGHLGVGGPPRVAPPFAGGRPGREDPRPDGRGVLRHLLEPLGGSARPGEPLDRPQRHPQVDAVEHRARQARDVAALGEARAGAVGVPGRRAGARVGRHHQLEAGGIADDAVGAREADLAVLERRAQHLQHVRGELVDLVQEQDAAVGQRHRARPRQAAAPADERGRRHRVVRGDEGRRGGQGLLGIERPRERAHRRHLERGVHVEVGQEPRHPARQHRLARARRADHQQVVAPGRRDLHRPAGRELPDDVGEVVRRGAAAGTRARPDRAQRPLLRRAARPARRTGARPRTPPGPPRGPPRRPRPPAPPRAPPRGAGPRAAPAGPRARRAPARRAPARRAAPPRAAGRAAPRPPPRAPSRPAPGRTRCPASAASPGRGPA